MAYDDGVRLRMSGLRASNHRNSPKTNVPEGLIEMLLMDNKGP